ncbi:hypothetical protein [Lentzea sp. NEAU-D7]|uniref:hypothetical protein n=1 Tax=Lentzea sp. NEAU-D7 TaxID=2994667 RepID=UPI00224A99B1|nr:hypothetical protein [Lentzea sp. NEAU-D7]MCX2955431.1 hypothetical protein [Lentzea sp. NEAU-D7]
MPTRKRGIFALTSALFLLVSLTLTPTANAYYSYEGSGACSGGNDAYNDYVCLYDSSTPGSGIFFRLEIAFSSQEVKVSDLRNYPFSGSGGGSWNDKISSLAWKINGPRGSMLPHGTGFMASEQQLALTAYEHTNYRGSQATVTTIPGESGTYSNNIASSLTLTQISVNSPCDCL